MRKLAFAGTLVAAIAVAVAALGSVGVESAAAKATVFSFTNAPSTSQAGGHPDVITTDEVGSHLTQGAPIPCECNDAKDVITRTPAGVIANPHSASECTPEELATVTCPPESQVGFVVFKLFGWSVLPLYHTVPQSGQGALYAFLLPLATPVPQYIAITARTGSDYGLNITVEGLIHFFEPTFLGVELWGVPGEPKHDLLRFAREEEGLECQANPLDSLEQDEIPAGCRLTMAELKPGPERKPPHSSSLPVTPFMQNPTTCAGPLVSTLETLAYDGETDTAEAPWGETTGCDKLSFNPSLSAAPTTSEADSASGLAVDIKVPQFQDPNTPSPSELRGSAITLPEGFTINPGAADGKSSCSDAQANVGNDEAAQCPEFSKIGTTEIQSSALPGPIYGYIYLGDPKPGDRYRIILTASGFGTNVKLAGSVRPDPVTGRQTTVFENLPQSPFQEFNLHFFGSERGLLATPAQCGTYEVRSSFEPWARELSDQTSVQFFQIDSGPEGKPCPNGQRPFAPSLEAGTEDNTGGARSPFTLQLRRADGEQNLASLTVKTPPGFSASLRGIPYCPEPAIESLHSLGRTALAEQAFPACPAASQVGSAIAGAGAGTHPLYLPGKAYLAGPYKGAPLSLVVVVPALSGPYDLGVVAVRAALQVDPESAQVTTVSDPLPQILEGIPLRTRFIRVSLDRPGFALNPTNCEPFAIESQVTGTEGALASPSAHFQVANCADLGFAPKLGLRLAGSTKRAGVPALSATLVPRAGDANFRSARVSLPKALSIDNAHLNGPCTRVQFNASQCPPSSVLGVAKAESPLLDGALRGPVYLRSNPDRELPDVVADLHGQLHVVLVGHTDQAKGRVRSSFEALPDVPVSSFSLALSGARKGIFENHGSLCAKAQKAEVSLTGQNGKSTSSAVKVAVPGCKKAAKPKRHKRRGRGK